MNRPLIITLTITLPVIAYQYHQNHHLTQATDPPLPWVDTPVHQGSADTPVRHGSVDTPVHDGKVDTPVHPTTLTSILAAPDPLTRLRSFFDYAANIPPAEIGDALAELRASSPDWDPEARIAAHLLLTRWGTEDPDAAFASLENLNPKKASADASAILSSFAAGNPQRAIAWLENPDNKLAATPYLGHILAGTIAKEWVRTDPDAALACSTLPDDQRAGAFTGVLRSLASDDPERASSLAMSLDPGKERTRAIGEIAQAWAQKSPAEALEWAATLDGTDRLNATGQSLETLTATDPLKAAAHLDTIANESERARLLTTVARSWSQRQPAEAASWLTGRPESNGKTDAMGWVAWHWTNADPQAASTWLIEQPESPSRDRAITSLAKATFDTDPAAAVTWATEITDPDLRDQSLTLGLTEWEKRDPEAAAAWVAGEK